MTVKSLRIARATFFIVLGAVAPAGSAAVAPGESQGPAAAVWRCERGPLVIANATLWAPGGGVAGQEILVVDGKIAAIGAAGSVRRPESVRVLDAGGATLLPGLIDSHAHLDAWPGPVPKELMPQDRAFATAGRQTLLSGVTTVRIHLSGLEEGPAFKRQADDDCFPSPRIALGGPGLFGGQPDLAARLAWGVKNADDARAKTRQIRSAGAQWLALHAADRFSAAELSAIIEEARKVGLRLMASGDRFEEIRVVVDAGVTSLEYLDRSTAGRYPDDLVKRLAERGEALYVVPPIGYYHRFMALRKNPGGVSDSRYRLFMPDPIAGSLLAGLEQQLRQETPTNPIETSFATLDTKFRQLREAGLHLVLGSDSGSPGQFHIDAIWHEMRAWRDLGVLPAEVLQAATSKPARMLGDSSIGVLAVGASADLVLYRGNLAAGDFDGRNVWAVVKGGVVFVQEGKWVGP